LTKIKNTCYTYYSEIHKGVNSKTSFNFLHNARDADSGATGVRNVTLRNFTLFIKALTAIIA